MTEEKKTYITQPHKNLPLIVWVSGGVATVDDDQEAIIINLDVIDDGDCPLCGSDVKMGDGDTDLKNRCSSCGIVWDSATIIDEIYKEIGFANSEKTVKLIAAGYEWSCPLCARFNDGAAIIHHTIETKEFVTCPVYNVDFEVSTVYHAQG